MSPNNDQEPIIIPIAGPLLILPGQSEDGEEIRITDPDMCKRLRASAREYNKKQGTRLPAAQAIVRALMEIWNHPVKSLGIGSVERQDQLAPSDLLPSKVGFDNTPVD